MDRYHTVHLLLALLCGTIAQAAPIGLPVTTTSGIYSASTEVRLVKSDALRQVYEGYSRVLEGYVCLTREWRKRDTTGGRVSASCIAQTVP